MIVLIYDSVVIVCGLMVLNFEWLVMRIILCECWIICVFILILNMVVLVIFVFSDSVL